MTRAQMTTLLFVLYGVLAFGITIWAHRRTHHPRDYFVGDRRGGAFTVAFAQAFHLVPVWAMLVISSAAFAWGYSAIWFALAFWLAGLVHVTFVAPRARALAASQHSVSLIHLLSFDVGERMQPSIVRFATLLLTLATLGLIVIQLQLIDEVARLTLSSTLGVVTIAIVLLVIATAGWWALVLLESIHALALLLVCVLTPMIAWVALDGWESILGAWSSLPPEFSQWDGGRKNVVAIAFIGGLLSFLWIPLGQPALINRAVGSRDERAQRTAGWLLMAWLTIALSSLLFVGWFGRALYDGLQAPHFIVFEIPSRVLHPAVAPVIGMLFIGALTTSVAAQVAVLKTAFTSDLRPGRALPANEWSRAVTVILIIVITLIAYFARPLSLDDLLLCWTALAAALAPLLFVRLSGKRVRRGSMLGAMSAGFLLVCVFHVMPDAPGDFLERVLPFVAALGIALSGGERRRNPDRADRTDETVHDRLPI